MKITCKARWGQSADVVRKGFWLRLLGIFFGANQIKLVKIAKKIVGKGTMENQMHRIIE